MDARTKIGILLIVYAVQVTLSAPAWDAVLQPGYRVRQSGEKETGRIFWSAIGDILDTLPFLPVTVNVPDVITSTWNFFAGLLPGGSGSGNKKPKRNSTSTVAVTRDDLIDYLLY